MNYDFARQANQRVTIQSLSLTDDGIGGQSGSWTDIVSLWAAIKPKSGTEILQNGQLISKVTHEVIIRYQTILANTQISAKHRIKVNNRVLNVLAILNQGHDLKQEGKVYQKLICIEGDTNS